jgi:hypothetical protein
MEQSIEDFFHDFRQELLAGQEANNTFQLTEFMETVADELVETGFADGYEFCHYAAQRGMRVDGYWFNDDGVLDLFVADFIQREEPESLTQTDVTAILKRTVNFFSASRDKELYRDLENTTPEYGLARQIADRKGSISRVNVFLISERVLSRRVETLEQDNISGVPFNYHIWDMSRLQRQRESRGHKEILEIDFLELFGSGIPCLPAHVGTTFYGSYLVVIPGKILSALYEKYGARLLEQNVRCFLQARSKVNKGIRTTIIKEPDMFFAYNNGITATASTVETEIGGEGLLITRVRDLQIVNGGQTTASLFHTNRKDKASLESIFVQMKLAVINEEDIETVVPRISEYANTQNKVNAADFFSNHPFHIRMEEISRRLWAPAKEGAQRETKWFYERARGQYLDAQSKLTKAEKNKFKAENPKPQMFTKTDLAKFENVWDDHPRWVNLGAQKNFARYATRIGREWEKSPDRFNDYYYRKVVARAIIFRATEKLVSQQPWYHGGYRANIVAYAISAISELCRRHNKTVDFTEIWEKQSPPSELINALSISAKFVNDDIVTPPEGISNISEWCKKEGCWSRILLKIDRLEEMLTKSFLNNLISLDQQKDEEKNASKVQKIDNGIDAQRRVLNFPAEKWVAIRKGLNQKKLLSPKEDGILGVACRIPERIPTDKQSMILIDILQRAGEEGLC